MIAISPSSTAVWDSKRYSFNYATRSQMNEMRQPDYIHDKRYGVFSNEGNVAKARRGLPHITPLYRTHMNLWDTDTDGSNNRFFRSYVFGQRELHLLLNRPHGFEADLSSAGQQGYSAYELNMDVRYKGVPQPAITNAHYEPEWQYTLYRQHGNKDPSALNNPRSPFTEEILGEELLQIRDIKSVEHCKAWFDRLQYLIQLHYDAVGDVGPFKSRHTQHVHTFFMSFYDALSSFDFQDHYLLEQFHRCRPDSLQDLFGVFLEMEANYVNEDYCPRCSLSLHDTRFCGEGDADTPFRKHRGRWAPHQKWGKEWYDVVVRRAEALWYRATEDPYFGTTEHSQKQVEALLKVYTRTKQRAKAVDFLHRLRGSKEFLYGRVTITPSMQEAYDVLLDTTPHPHLLTNQYSLEEGVAGYLGERNVIPHSPLQMRLDLERDKWRRQQKEEGVVRVPPAGWKVDTSTIVPYAVDPKTKHITNWREVKKGIEDSFIATGLPDTAYSSLEMKQRIALRHEIAQRGARRAVLETQLRKEKEAVQQAKKGATSLIFPDRYWYRVFDTSPEALKSFGLSSPAGTLFTAVTKVLPDPAAVTVSDDKDGGQKYVFNTTEVVREWFGEGMESGAVLRWTPKDDKGKPFDAVVVGVNQDGPESDWSLFIQRLDDQRLVNVGKNVSELYDRFARVEPLYKVQAVPLFRDLKTVKEEVVGQTVGVRDKQLYVQWRLLPGGGEATLNKSVAVPLGDISHVQATYKIREIASSTETLEEPPSWQTPFRNDFLDEKLKEVELKPFSREQWASLVEGKYTPKEKIYGYTQHNKVDDFETKEYKDRLLSRQYFHNPQGFEVIPEAKERSVLFRGKEEHRQVSGLPTVDRDELEKAYQLHPSQTVTDEEEQLIEQALRDISGNRPGNFIKSNSERSKLELNESWWTPFQYGWEERNREVKALYDPTEQRLVEGGSLPFRGALPPFGTSYGIGERMREIIQDYTKGFGLGPHQHSPSSDLYRFDSFNNEQKRSQRLTLENVVVRLFNEKMWNQNNKEDYQWALEMISAVSPKLHGTEINVKQLLLSLREWREQGRKPSLLLVNVLNIFLKDEIEQFNQGLPAGVPRLRLAHLYDTTTATAGEGENNNNNNKMETADGRLWEETDALETKMDYYNDSIHHRTRSEEAYILSLVQSAQEKEMNASVFSDNALRSYTAQYILQEFQLELTTLVGKDIPPSVTAARTQANNGNHARNGGNVAQLVRASELAKLLEKYQVTSQGVMMVIRGLSLHPEQQSLPAESTTELSNEGGGLGKDFAVPVSLILSWTGPSGTNPGGRDGNQNNNNRSGGGSNNSNSHNNVMATLRRDTGAKTTATSSSSVHSKDKMVVHVLEELSYLHDGAAADIQYAIAQNSKNPYLQQEFITAFASVFQNDVVKTQHQFKEYTEGKYVPNITVAFEVFVHFLKKAAKATVSPPTSAEKGKKKGEDIHNSDHNTSSSNNNNNDFIKEFFDLDWEDITAGETPRLRQARVRLLPLTKGPFRFENTLLEELETFHRFNQFHITAGISQVPTTGFIAANSKGLNYFQNSVTQPSSNNPDITHVTQHHDGNLVHYVTSQDFYKDFMNQAAHHAHRHPLHFLFSLPQGAGIVSSFHRYFYRVAPMLSFYEAILRTYQNNNSNNNNNMNKEGQHYRRMLQEASIANQSLRHLLQADRAGGGMEIEFRRNAERYWRGVLDGKYLEEQQMIASQQNNNNNNNRYSNQNQNQNRGGYRNNNNNNNNNNNRQAVNRVKVNLTNILSSNNNNNKVNSTNEKEVNNTNTNTTTTPPKKDALHSLLTDLDGKKKKKKK